MDYKGHSRSRSRSRDRHENNEGHSAADARMPSRDDRNGSDGGNNLYITNLSFQTTEESLRAFFRVLGEVSNASVVREPQTQSSRGFGFVSFVDYADSERAVQELNGKELDSRIIRVEKARRASGYDKTPGRYLGPPQVSAKFGTAAGWAKDAPRNGGDRMSDNYRMGGDRVGDMGGDRYPPSYDRGGGGGGGGYATSRDERGYGGGGGYDRPAPIYREERGRDRDREPPREVSRELPRYEPRGRSPPPAYYDDRRRVGGSGGGYDDRRIAPVASRGGREEYTNRSFSRPREDVRRGGPPPGPDRGAPYGGYNGGYDSRPPSSSGGGYEIRGGGPPRGRY